jgi:anhydro-N-acetylmuramic acid kinase
MRDLYIGLMSGTSLDGVDGVLVEFMSGAQAASIRVITAATEPFTNRFRAELLALNSQTDNELHRAALAAGELARAYARVTRTLLENAADSGVKKPDIAAIGAHGQTVRHQPAAGYTLQLGNGALLAELTGIDVVADFRSRDVAAGGQGAPLAPGFHQFLFGEPDRSVAVLNLGGISNLTILPPRQPENGNGQAVLGFDCGPANALMDAWCQQHTGQPYDAAGAWAATGQLIEPLLTSLLEESYLTLLPPKSTGRDLFSLAWLARKLLPYATARPADIQYTLAEFTVSACTADFVRYGKNSNKLIVCGGGAFNNHVMARLQARLPGVLVQSSDQAGLPPLQVEAAAFAWLARQTLLRAPGNLASVTGASGPRVLGAIYPA